jgi:tRNA pseudouridine32 synthase/23S rRNA pseudouridine746 synthase
LNAKELSKVDESYMISSMEKFILKSTIGPNIAGKVSDYLASETGLSKVSTKDAMNKGSVWVGREKGGLRKLRKATALLSSGMRIEFHYDEALLAIVPPQARCLIDRKDYSVWVKPAGLVSQGTMYGDHCSLIRQAEIFFEGKREIFLVHRLDREADGLMLVAHTKKAAALLSEIFQKNLIIKKYRVEILGDLAERGPKGTIELPLDGKIALTLYEVDSYDPASNTSTVDVTIKTGRLHQIRRHLDMIGFPVMGDPKYGKGNKNTGGMKLVAYLLKFTCPLSKREVEYNI